MKVTTTLLILLSAALVPTAIADKGHEAHAGHMLQGYQKVAHALFQDNLETAKAEAAKMAHHDEESACAPHAEAIAAAKSLEEARGHFKMLSAEAIKMAEKREGYVVMHCPMVKGGGGDWLQSKEHAAHVQNPYFGSQMPNCGAPKKPKAE